MLLLSATYVCNSYNDVLYTVADIYCSLRSSPMSANRGCGERVCGLSYKSHQRFIIKLHLLKITR